MIGRYLKADQTSGPVEGDAQDIKARDKSPNWPGNPGKSRESQARVKMFLPGFYRSSQWFER